MSSQPLHVRGAGKRWRDKPKRPLPSPTPAEESELDPAHIVALEKGPATELLHRSSCADPLGPNTDAAAPEDAVRSVTYAGLRVRPARMWGWGLGNGFCGETCLQQALLWWGSYVSAERIRYAAGNNELLVGVHDKKAAKALRLAYDSFDSESIPIPEPQHEAFAGWAAWHVGQGHHVTAGWYTFTDAGDDEYDHIMPIVGAHLTPAADAGEAPAKAAVVTRKGGKASPPRKGLAAQGGRVASLDFLDLAQDKLRRVHRGRHGPDGTLFASRAEASAPKAAACAAAYPPADETGYVYALPTQTLYGIAVTGNAGPPSERFCLSLRPASDGTGTATPPFAAGAGLWREPDWGAEDRLDEAPVPLVVSGRATGLCPQVAYALLRFDDPAAVPEKAGGKGLDGGRKWRRKWTFVAPAAEVELRAFDTVPSDGAHFYRLVRSSS